jgi:hypothetical protein
MLCFLFSVWVRKYLLWSPFGGNTILQQRKYKKLYFLAPAVLSALRKGKQVDVDPHLLTTDRTCLHALLILKKVCCIRHAKRATAGAYFRIYADPWVFDATIGRWLEDSRICYVLRTTESAVLEIGSYDGWYSRLSGSWPKRGWGAQGRSCNLPGRCGKLELFTVVAHLPSLRWGA